MSWSHGRVTIATTRSVSSRYSRLSVNDSTEGQLDLLINSTQQDDAGLYTCSVFKAIVQAELILLGKYFVLMLLCKLCIRASLASFYQPSASTMICSESMRLMIKHWHDNLWFNNSDCDFCQFSKWLNLLNNGHRSKATTSIAQLSQRNCAAGWISYGWVVGAPTIYARLDRS